MNKIYVIIVCLLILSPMVYAQSGVDYINKRTYSAVKPGQTPKLGRLYTRFDGDISYGIVFKSISDPEIPDWLFVESDSLMSAKIIVQHESHTMQLNMIALNMVRYKIAKRFAAHIEQTTITKTRDDGRIISSTTDVLTERNIDKTPNVSFKDIIGRYWVTYELSFTTGFTRRETEYHILVKYNKNKL